MEKSTTPDEKPKRTVAKHVITDKRKYFVPAHGVSVDARSAKEAASLAKRSATKEEDGDGK